MPRANPALVVLSAICHRGYAKVDGIFPALAEALRSFGTERAILYYDLVLAALPMPARTRWETFMRTMVDYEFRSEMLRDLAARHKAEGEEIGKAEGKAQGEATAVLTVLDARGVRVPSQVREQIMACTDLAQLETWLRRAGTATTIDDVIHA